MPITEEDKKFLIEYHKQVESGYVHTKEERDAVLRRFTIMADQAWWEKYGK